MVLGLLVAHMCFVFSACFRGGQKTLRMIEGGTVDTADRLRLSRASKSDDGAIYGGPTEMLAPVSVRN